MGSYFDLFLVFEIEFLGIHDIQQDLEGNDQIRVNYSTGLVTLFLGKSPAVNDSHLLDNGGLAGLSRSWFSR